MYSVLNYIGKKEVELLEDMEVLNIETYCEPFSGSFNTGFKLIDKGYNTKYILNDLDKNIYNFWVQLKSRYNLLELKINKMIDDIDKIKHKYPDHDTSKEIEHYIDTKLKSGNKLDRAAAEFIYRQSLTMSGLKYRREKIECILLLDFFLNSEYLTRVNILNKDYKEVLTKYDSKHTFFFIDPPYNINRVGQYYRCESNKFNHQELYNIVTNLKGRWLMTYNYDEKLMEMYKDYNIEIKERKMFGRVYREMYIRNYKI